MENVNHPIEGLMKSTLENFHNMIDVNAIIGDCIEVKDGSTIIPISKVSFGFASGGSEFFKNKESEQNSGNVKYPFGGASGAGVSLKPVAFIVIKDDCVKLLSVDHENTYDRMIDSIPQIFDLLKGLGKNKTCHKNSQTTTNNCSNSNTTTSDAY